MIEKKKERMTSVNNLNKINDVVKYMDEKWVITKVWYNGQTHLWVYNLALLTKDDTFYDTTTRKVEAIAIPACAIGLVLFNLDEMANKALDIIHDTNRKTKWENKDKPPQPVAGGYSAFCDGRSASVPPAPWTEEDEAKLEAKKKAYTELASKE